MRGILSRVPLDFQAERHATTILLHDERKNPNRGERVSKPVQNAKYEVQNADRAFNLHFVLFILHFAFLFLLRPSAAPR